MPPEDKAQQLPPDSTGDEWDGPWGSISAVAHSVEILCIQIETQPGKPRIHYYPYRTMGKWTWSMDQPESLDICAGGMQIMITGTGLRRLADALNLGQLRLVQWSEQAVHNGTIVIQAIRVESSQ